MAAAVSIELNVHGFRIAPLKEKEGISLANDHAPMNSLIRVFPVEIGSAVLKFSIWVPKHKKTIVCSFFAKHTRRRSFLLTPPTTL